MNISFEWIRGLLVATGLFGIFLGIFSLLSPARSIGFYQWIMRNFNWRVEPIDHAKELRNTRWLGSLLCVLSLLIVWVVRR